MESIQYGTSERANENNEGYKILRMNNLQDEGISTKDIKHIVLSEKEYINLRLDIGDILFNRTNSKELVGKCAVFELEGDWVFASYLLRVKVKSGLLLPKFAQHILSSPFGRLQIDCLSRQIIGMTNINTEEIKLLQIPLPPLEIQAQIVEMMDRAIETKQGLEAEANEMLAGIDDWLLSELGIEKGEKNEKKVFIIKIADIKGNRIDVDYSISKTAHFENFPKLNENIKVRTGDPFPSAEFGNGEVPLIRIREVLRGLINTSDAVKVSSKFKDTYPKSIPNNGEILVGMDGDEFRGALYKKEMGEIFINQRVAIITPGKNVYPRYLELLINSSIVIDQFERKRSVAGVVGHISSSDIRNLQIPLPPLSEQERIAEHISAIIETAWAKREEARRVYEEARRDVERMILGN